MSQGQGFERIRPEEIPYWFDDEVGQAYEAVRGRAQDTELRTLKDGVLIGLLETTPDDGLDRIGAGFNLERFPGESDASYRARLPRAWALWQMAGARGTDALPSAIVQSLRDFGIEDVELREDHEWEGAPGEWTSRFWVVLGPATPWLPMRTPFVTVEGMTTLGSTATRGEVLAVKRQVLKFKSPHSFPVTVIVKFDSSFITGPGVSMPFVTEEACCRWELGKVWGHNYGQAMPFTTGGWLL